MSKLDIYFLYHLFRFYKEESFTHQLHVFFELCTYLISLNMRSDDVSLNKVAHLTTHFPVQPPKTATATGDCHKNAAVLTHFSQVRGHSM